MLEDSKHVTYEEGVMNLVTAIVEQVVEDYTFSKAKELTGNITDKDMQEIDDDIYFFLHSDLLACIFLEDERNNIISRLDEIVESGYYKYRGKWVKYK